MLKKIHVIINPAAGQEEPILSMLNKALHDSGIKWDISVTHREGDAQRIATEVSQQGVDAVVVYGGDGTVVEVAKALFKKATPMAILPGGTANVLAKELKVSKDTNEAIKLLVNNKFTIMPIDVGVACDNYFLICVAFGALADINQNTKRKLKDSLGNMAYGVNAVKQLSSMDKVTYKMTLDGESIQEDGYTLLVANSGNIGVEGLSLLPDISITDGLLDIIVIQKADIFSLLKILGSSTVNSFPQNAIKRWKAKEISIETSHKQTIICDDFAMECAEFKIKIEPQAINVIVPSEDS